MGTARDHYEHLLARHYTWMFGVPFDQKVEEQKALLRQAGIYAPGVAVDLGCGSGFQTMALAGLGAVRVHAVDTSAALLGELAHHARDCPVTTHEADLSVFDRETGEAADTIVCMGDTLTHLASGQTVAALFGRIFGNLREGGRMVLSWRDLTDPPRGLNRFIPLRNTDDRMMVCFLEDQGDTVLVHDLLHIRGEDGWHFEASAYPKLKLSADGVRAMVTEAGLDICYEETVRGMIVMAATKGRS